MNVCLFVCLQNAVLTVTCVMAGAQENVMMTCATMDTIWRLLDILAFVSQTPVNMSSVDYADADADDADDAAADDDDYYY